MNTANIFGSCSYRIQLTFSIARHITAQFISPKWSIVHALFGEAFLLLTIDCDSYNANPFYLRFDLNTHENVTENLLLTLDQMQGEQTSTPLNAIQRISTIILKTQLNNSLMAIVMKKMMNERNEKKREQKESRQFKARNLLV